MEEAGPKGITVLHFCGTLCGFPTNFGGRVSSSLVRALLFPLFDVLSGWGRISSDMKFEFQLIKLWWHFTQGVHKQRRDN